MFPRNFTILVVLCLVLTIAFGVNETEFESHGCSSYHKWPDQPNIEEFAIVKKCCRDNENLHVVNSTSTSEIFGCYPHIYPVIVTFSLVDLYEDCLLFRNRSAGEIELKNSEKLPDHEYFPCMYYGDFFGTHIIQNGSLLVTNTFGHFAYRLNNDFCIDADTSTGAYMVCHDADESKIPVIPPPKKKRHVSIKDKLLTIVSVPCFIAIALLYIFITEFRNMHGVCVISYAVFLTVEFVLRCIGNSIKGDVGLPLVHTIQYFDLMNHFWTLVLFTNTLLFVWIYLPYKHVEWRPFGICCYGIFFLFCMMLPTLISDHLQDNEIRTFLDFLTTPKTTIVLICILLQIILFVGSNRLTVLIKKEILQKYFENSVIDNHEIEVQRHHFELEEVQTRLTCLASLTGLMVVLRIFSIPGHSHLELIRDTLKSLQGIGLVLIFIVLRYKEIRNFAWRRFKR